MIGEMDVRGLPARHVAADKNSIGNLVTDRARRERHMAALSTSIVILLDDKHPQIFGVRQAAAPENEG